MGILGYKYGSWGYKYGYSGMDMGTWVKTWVLRYKYGYFGCIETKGYLSENSSERNTTLVVCNVTSVLEVIQNCVSWYEDITQDLQTLYGEQDNSNVCNGSQVKINGEIYSPILDAQISTAINNIIFLYD
jgi:hypothetical protein